MNYEIMPATNENVMMITYLNTTDMEKVVISLWEYRIFLPILDSCKEPNIQHFTVRKKSKHNGNWLHLDTAWIQRFCITLEIYRTLKTNITKKKKKKKKKKIDFICTWLPDSCNEKTFVHSIWTPADQSTNPPDINPQIQLRKLEGEKKQ